MENELEEQINMDGGHFERSIMYHKIILHRVLQSIDLIRSNPSFEDEGEVLDLLNSKAEMMLGYLRLMSFEDGSFPHFNDSCDGIAPDSDLIFSNASKLDLNVRILPLGQSGFRKFSNEVFEGFINVGSLLPKYIPGHAHSDIAHFVMHLNNRPFIVDTGISTYESNEIRTLERSTSSHNTVVVNNRNQSDVWSAFRVGKKASVLELVEGLRSISISHDAYQKFAIQHRRSFTWTNKSISIIDDVGKEEEACAFLHFHPNVKISENASIYTVEDCYIDFEFANRVEIEDYMFSYGFNDRVTAKRMCIWFTKKLVTKLTVK